jgi:hypothetical protein
LLCNRIEGGERLNVEQTKRTITIVLEPKDGLIPLPSFRTAIDQLSTLVNEVTREISEPKPQRISWGISRLSMNSPATITIESTEGEFEGIAERTASTVIKGLYSLQNGQKRPEAFNDNALESAQRLARLTIDGLARVNLYANIPDHQVYLSEQIAVNVSAILESLDYHGSVEGVLELISGKEGQPIYFRVKDRVYNVSVRCIIPDELVQDALNAFKKRVIVSGIIKSDNSGTPRTIKADNIEIVPSVDSLPQANDIIRELEGKSFRIQPYEHQP